LRRLALRIARFPRLKPRRRKQKQNQFVAVAIGHRENEKFTVCSPAVNLLAEYVPRSRTPLALLVTAGCFLLGEDTAKPAEKFRRLLFFSVSFY
jgi:hypothetical protein